MTNEEKLLIAKCEDLFARCDKYVSARFSQFLNEAEQAVIKNNIGNRVGYNCCFFGGYENAQRAIFAVFPEWEEPDNKQFPIKVLKITKKYKKELSHRDYLGTVLSKGIERLKVGDILIDGDDAYVFIISDIADYIAVSIDKIANVGVKITVEEVTDIEPPKPKFEIINTIAASVRLDAITAAALNVSRRVANELITGGKVSINHVETTDTSAFLKQGDTISVRGFGKFVFESIGMQTRSQRMHIEIKKYV